MKAPNPLRAAKPPVAPIRDGEHYRHLLGRTKWYILISGPIVLLLGFAYVFFVMRPENPELTARTLIGLERAADVTGVKVGVTANLGREDIMMSRTFLKDVAEKLSLQLWTAPYGRDAFFDSVSIDSSVPCGTYWVRFSPRKSSEYLIYYYDTNAIWLPYFGFLPGSKSKIVAFGNWASDTAMNMSGLSLKLSRSIKAEPRAFKFRVVDIRVAVEEVYRNLTIKRADPDKGINYIAVLLTSRDYSLAAATANAIADGFTEKNFSFRQQRMRGVVGTLEKQLQLSQAKLVSAESKIRDFRSANPQIGLDQQTQQTVNRLAQLGNGIHTMSADKAKAAYLRKRVMNSDPTEHLQLVNEIADLLSGHSVSAGLTLKDELDRLMTQHHKLSDTYGAEHPMVLENNRAIKKVGGAILAALDEFSGTAQTEISNNRRDVKNLSNRLRQLPALEMQLGELQRNQQIFADIYSAVLSSYNKAKVADAVETTDFYVMDYAVAPLPPPADKGRLLLICVLIAILASFGPVLAYDFFDKSVRSQRQLAKITSRRVLESIPVFFQVNGKRFGRKSVSRSLINVPCNPIFTREIFDSLLLKIKLNLFKSTDHAIVVSSLEDGIGKSTISSNLALVSAMRGHRTLLIDGDLRRGTVQKIFSLPDCGGLAALLSGHSPLTDDECMRSIVKTKIPELYALPSGPEPQNPGALLSSLRMEELRQFCEKNMEYTVMDTPPLGAVSDAAVIQKMFAHYLFVVRAGKTKVAELVNRINEFDELHEKILGYVLNGASPTAVGAYQRYSSYYVH